MTRTGLTIRTENNGPVHVVFEIGHDDYDGVSIVLYVPDKTDADVQQPFRAPPIELYSWLLTAEDVELIDPGMARAIMHAIIHGGTVDQWQSEHNVTGDTSRPAE